MSLSVVIPVYKKTDMFVANLVHNIALLPSTAEIIVVDDASQEYIREKLDQHVKKGKVQLLENEKNMGFSRTINKGISNSSGEYILLLNSDVRLKKKFTSDLYIPFKEDATVAAISFGEEGDGDSILGKSVINFSRGLVTHNKAMSTTSGLTAWANGGSCLFAADKLKKLGAFDVMYSPFYWEDIDLSFRAYSMGWKILFNPNFVVEHMRESTISTFYSSHRIKNIAFRNQFLFTWAHITDIDLIAQHLLWLPVHLLLMSIKGETEFVTGFFSALKFLPTILQRRSVQLRSQKRSNKEIFSLFT